MAPQNTTAGSGEDKPEGLSKYLRRMKTVLRPRSGNKRQSVATLPDAAGPSTTATPPAPTAVSRPADTERPMPTDSSVIQQERTRALLAKYGLSLEPDEWKSPTDLQQPTRVNKPIRMRVRRTCHRCQTTFGPDKVCTNCQHPRCKQCPRSPSPQEKDAEHLHIPKLKVLEIRSRHPTASIGLHTHLKLTVDPHAPLTLPSRTGGQDLVHKSVLQRVRRTCHCCNEAFTPGSKECQSCKHLRCKLCPREPPKPDKYPNGYPGDVEPPRLIPNRTYKKPRARVHYICHVCETSYNPGANTCSKCGVGKCAETTRIPPRKTIPDPDPDVLRRVEEKIGLLKIND